MADPKDLPWHLIHEDEIWTIEPESQYVGTIENSDYPADSSLGQYIVDMHNAQLDKIENSLPATHFDYEKWVSELWEEA